MQDIFSNQKSYFWKNQVRSLRVPLWVELGIGKIWPQAAQLDGFFQHIPSDWSADSKKVDHTFFWQILITLALEYVEQLVIDCREQRLRSQQERLIRPQALSVAPNWVEQLLA